MFRVEKGSRTPHNTHTHTYAGEYLLNCVPGPLTRTVYHVTVCNVIIWGDRCVWILRSVVLKILVAAVSAPRLKAATTQMLCVANQPCDLPAQEDGQDRIKITTSHENQQRAKQHRLPDRNKTNATVRLVPITAVCFLRALWPHFLRLSWNKTTNIHSTASGSFKLIVSNSTTTNTRN